MAGSPQHLTLPANTVVTVTFDTDFNEVEVVNVDGIALVYFTVDRSTPAIGGTGSHVLPAAIGGLTVKPGTTGATIVKLISPGTPAVSVRGIA